MRIDPRDTAGAPASSTAPGRPARPVAYEPPRFELLALDCEITAYAPDGDDPLF